MNPSTCILTTTCTSQSEWISLNWIMQLIPPFKNYTSTDSKKFFLEIQVGCAGKKKAGCFFFYFLIYLNLGAAFVISLIYIFIFIACRIKVRERVIQDFPAPVATAPPPPSLSPPQYEYPPAKPSSIPPPWTTQAPYTPH